MWQPTAQYHKVVEANRLFYAQTADLYDTTETCIKDTQAQQLVENDLDYIVKEIKRHSQNVIALDACGGSGNISLKLLQRGISVTTCDISTDLLALFQQKADAAGFATQIVYAEIGAFLSNGETKYDLIVFSSALHHLENIEEILALAFTRLRPQGILYTVFDPTPHNDLKFITKGLLQLDYFLFKILQQSRDLGAAAKRRFLRTLSNERQDKSALDLRPENLGVLAEYHVNTGIDDLALVAFLKRLGFQVLKHDRYAGGRYAFTHAALNRLGDATNFKLVLQKI